MLDILQEFLGTGAGGLGLKHLRLDGSTPVVERQARLTLTLTLTLALTLTLTLTLTPTSVSPHTSRLHLA